MARTYLPTKRAHLNKAAQNQTTKTEPEWGDEKVITRLFGITHTPLFNLRKAGKIRSISTAYGSATYGKRLFNIQSVRDFLEAQERDQSSTNKEGARP
jgi:hypothetical protein